MFYIVQIILWLLFLLFISSKIKRKNIRIIFSIIASLVSTLEIVSVYMTERFLDYRFYNHMNANAVEGQVFQFGTQILVFVGLFIILSGLFYFISKKMNNSLIRHNKVFIPMVLIFFILLSIPHGILNETYQLYKILNAKQKSFNQALKDVGIPPKQYITPEYLTAEKGKNIIVISIESLEQGFLGKNFNNLTPNLTQLSQKWTYFNHMPVGPGSGWTSGSLYTHQVGVPAFFKGQGNDFFQGSKKVKLTGLGHILNKAGYNIKYLVGHAEFSGMSDILTAYNIPVVSEKNSIGKYPSTDVGLNDYDLFKEAKLQINQFQQQKGKPFALFLSTINTHFPNGIYDKRMEKFISKKDNNLEFSVAAVDYLIGDFLKFLKEKKLLENTSIYIFPDHTLMGSSGPVLEKLKKSKRQIYLITNVKRNIVNKDTNKMIYQIDLPRIIIDGAEIKTNANFLTDFIKIDDKIDFLNKHRVEITSLNAASVLRSNFRQGIDITLKENNLIIKSGIVNKQVSLTGKESIIDFTFNSEAVLISTRRVNRHNAFTVYPYDKNFKRLHLLVYIKDNKLYQAYFGNKQSIGLYKKGQDIAYSQKDIQNILLSNTLYKTEEPVKQTFKSIISITSSEFVTNRTIGSKIQVKNKTFGLSRGLNLLTVDQNGTYHLDKFDTYGSQQDAGKFLVKIENLVKHHNFFAIASCDAIKSNYPGFKEKLSKLNFKVLQTLNGRFAYIAYTDKNNNIKEYSSKTSLSHVIPSYIKPLSKKEVKEIKKKMIQNNLEANNYAKDKNRFIAHAGGQIDGHTYTDSLDALDLSYKKGFRLFELDITKTSDNIYVAGHDWKHWAKITGYIGKLPPDRETFKKEKIYEKYTSMDITDINEWFKNHPDAILVTDKVNTPKDFSEKFIDKSRLMMELFTWDAVKEGIDAGIKSSMPTGSILDTIKGDKIAYLKELGITDIASSRRIINSQKAFVKSIVDSGIHIYAFHVNFDKGKDEKYVVCEERNYFYGMYADNWDFNAVLDCNKKQDTKILAMTKNVSFKKINTLKEMPMQYLNMKPILIERFTGSKGQGYILFKGYVNQRRSS